MKIFKLRKTNLPKIAVLATGLAAAALVATVSTQAAQATPRAASCAGCHGPATAGTATATPSTSTPTAGASYTVAITLLANPNAGNTGYGIVAATTGTGSTFGGNTGTQLSFTATMTAPAASGTYNYTVWTNQGLTDGTARVGSAVYSITVTGGSTALPPTTTSTPPVTSPAAPAPAASSGGVHGPYLLNSAQCGTCHRTHTAKAPNLLKSASSAGLGSRSTLCLSCHDGTVASPAVSNQYALVRPVNNPIAREYYSHDALAATPAIPHTESLLNEFGGVLNRHSECADCHNSHQATATAARDSAQNADGWEASRRLAGVSGVSVVNGAADSAPTYKFLSGADTNVVPANAVTREYQLCFKCHSGFTTLTSNAPLVTAATPPVPLYSKFALDKGIEFNPNNPSFHPVEAPGTNQTTAMAASLAGTSPYKLWNFTIGSTIRCLNCHASSATPDPAPTAVPPRAGPGAGSSLPPHTSASRGILLRPYRDRLLKPGSDVTVNGVLDKAAYNSRDFALCYACHAEAPFATETGTATNFGFHGYHITALSRGGSTVPGIDTPGAGNGNAICAECHFRLHSTTNKVGAQVLTGATAATGATGTRLVNFAPNVLPYNGTLSWSSTGVGKGSCTLTCHGVSHTPETYSGAP